MAPSAAPGGYTLHPKGSFASKTAPPGGNEMFKTNLFGVFQI